MYYVVLSKQAIKDIKNLKAAKLDTKAHDLIEIVKQTPFSSPPKCKPLEGNLAGLYSRRINLKHRFVYKLIEEPIEINGEKYDGTVQVLRMWTHYQDVQ